MTHHSPRPIPLFLSTDRRSRRGHWCHWVVRGGPALVGVFLGALLLLAPQSFAAESSAAESVATIDKFLRLQRSEEGDPTALETAVVRYARPGKPARGANTLVDLVGAIHVGERDYYEGLNKRFRDYDVVLYELVVPDDSVVPKPGQRSGSPLTAVQLGMKNLLGLQFQLDCIDYQQENMTRADLTFEEFAASMADRGESFAKMFFRMLGQSMAMQAKAPARSSDLQLLAALFSKDRSFQLKRVFAEEFERGLSVSLAMEGPDGSTIITVRNRRAIDVLEKQLRLGHRRIAIFYGAAHLPDMEQQLRERLGFRPVETNWVTAWKLTAE